VDAVVQFLEALVQARRSQVQFPVVLLEFLIAIILKKQNKMGYLKIKNYKFERVTHFKYLAVILSEN
jgi:hypothetical protein